MLSFFAKATFAGLMVALITVVAKKYPGWGGLLAALPITSLLALSLLYLDTRDAEQVSQLSTSILAFIVPSIPLFIALPILLRSGINYWAALAIVAVGTMLLFALSFAILPRLGVKL